MIRKILRVVVPAPMRQTLRDFYADYVHPLFRPLRMQESFLDYDDYWDLRSPPPEEPASGVNFWKPGDAYGPFVRASEADKVIRRLFDRPISILEIGAGDGYVLRFLRDRGHRVFGVDISERAVSRMKGSGIPAKRADILQGAVSDESFDLVLLMSVLEHVPEAEEFLEASCRYATRYVLITVPNTGYWIHRIRLFIFGRVPETNVVFHVKEHVRFWTVTDFLEWARQLGYQVHSIAGLRGLPYLCRLYPRLFASSVMYTVSRPERESC